MRKLKLVGLSADGRRVVFVDDAGAEFAAPADDRLRAALRGDRARLGQLEIEMDSVLRPRDIQARIRVRRDPRQRRRPRPGLGRQDHAVLRPRAGRAPTRRRPRPARLRPPHERRRPRPSTSPTSSPSGCAAADSTRSQREWDAWRRDDGRWSVGVSYQSGEREQCRAVRVRRDRALLDRRRRRGQVAHRREAGHQQGPAAARDRLSPAIAGWRPSRLARLPSRRRRPVARRPRW